MVLASMNRGMEPQRPTTNTINVEEWNHRQSRSNRDDGFPASHMLFLTIGVSVSSSFVDCSLLSA